MAPGKDQSTMSGIISEAMHKAHQLTTKAPTVPTEYVRKLMRTEKVKSINVGLVRDVELHLRRAVIHKDCEESNNLAQVGILIANFRRSLNDKYRNRAMKEVEREGQPIVEAIVPEDRDKWQTTTAQKAIKKHKGVEQFFTAVTDFISAP